MKSFSDDSNIALEGTMSQFFFQVLGFILLKKTGNFFNIFSTFFSQDHKTKTKTYTNI